MRKVIAIAWNSLVQMARDPMALALALLLPLLLTAILGTALKGMVSGEELRPATVLVLNEDSSFGRSLVDGLLQSETIRQVMSVRPADDLATARREVAAGKATALIYIPSGFTADALAGRKAEVELDADPADPTRSAWVEQVVQGYTDTLVTNLVAARLGETVPGTGPSPRITRVASGAHPVSSMQYYAVAMMLMFMITTGIQRGGKLLEERESGLLQRMLLAPVGRWAVLTGEVAGSTLVLLSQCVLLMAGTRLLFQVDWGPWGGALALGGLYALAASGIGIALASILKNKTAADIAAGAAGNLLGLLSGALIPLYAFPDALKLVSRLTPNYWALEGFLRQMAGGTDNRLWVPAAVLTAVALVTAGTGLWRLSAE